MSTIRMLAVFCGIFFCAAGWPAEPGFPAKPIRLLVPATPGGIIDVSARLIARALEPQLGKPVIVENRPGATYQIAINLCARASADGHTMCQVNISTHSFNPYVFKTLAYDPVKDFKPVYFQLSAIQGLMAYKTTPFNSVSELKDYATRNRGRLNFATLGSGSSADLFCTWLNKIWGTDITGIGYGGGVQIALQSGESQLTIVGVGTLADLVRAGEVKLLAVSARERIPQFPNAPTFHEVGLGAYPSSFWLGIAVPAGTSDAIVRKLNAAFVEAAKDPRYQEYLNGYALQTGATTPEGFAEFMERDRKAAETIIKLTGVSPR